MAGPVITKVGVLGGGGGTDKYFMLIKQPRVQVPSFPWVCNGLFCG